MTMNYFTWRLSLLLAGALTFQALPAPWAWAASPSSSTVRPEVTHQDREVLDHLQHDLQTNTAAAPVSPSPSALPAPARAAEAAPSAPAPVGARETLLNSAGQSFDEVWAIFTAARDPHVYDDAALATLLAQLHGAPASDDERRYAAGFAQMTLEEFGQTFRAYISSTPPVFSDLPHLLKKEPTDNVALLREFLDVLSRGLRRDEIMLLRHHIMNPYIGIRHLTTLLEDSSLSDEDAHSYREIVQQKCQAQAFIRELLLHRWRKPSDEEPAAGPPPSEPMLPLPGISPAAISGTDQVDGAVESLGASAGEV